MNLILTPNGYIPVDEPAIVTTQTDYDALSDEAKANGVYYITDDDGKPITETIGSTDISSYGSDITTAISTIGSSMFKKSNIANDLITSVDGYALDARQGKALQDKKVNKYDSGWRSVTFSNGWKESTTGGAFRYRILNGVLYTRGSVAHDASGSSVFTSPITTFPLDDNIAYNGSMINYGYYTIWGSGNTIYRAIFTVNQNSSDKKVYCTLKIETGFTISGTTVKALAGTEAVSWAYFAAAFPLYNS